MRFEEYILKDIVDIRSSKRIYYKDYVSQGIPFYRSKEIIKKSQGVYLEELLFINQEKFTEIKKKYGVPKEGDMLLTSVGTIGVPYLVKENEEFYFKDGNLTWFTNFSNDLSNEYLFYWLISPIGKRKLESIQIGTSQKALTMIKLKEICIKLPKIDYQQKVVTILNRLRKKIELNDQIINTLEETATTLFNHWFIDFEFPDKSGNPYKSSGGKMIESELGEIPEGWEVSSLKNITEIIMGQSPKGTSYNNEDMGLPLINGASDFKNGFVNPKKYTTEPKKVTKQADIIFGVRATIGNPTIVQQEYAIGRGAGIARVKNNHYQEFVFLLLEEMFKYFANTGSGSVYINISKNDFESYKFISPSFEVILKFHESVMSIFELIANKRIEIESLKELRDTLLPKLLSGEIELE
ncbi:restriction endonuclease subunit S [Enterococcus sp. DIV0242_7C1]|uniref:Type I restriction enzyme, S subunit n=1 Tax=Candidatus Enterococcus dunnyi TaxID=1834192 RepID=A0A200JDF0_9ENTE|nr:MULTISPECIES: restriction endonuclease subunit S [unclassified Enterococcus]MBO0469481.1 restriction endonuclease subunit S [Enterococcus sp. DIV0242_7C1]OUZ35224.1 hypothetical protein A5889_000700 [Enterococcus sp. 9D6_DIV0238]